MARDAAFSRRLSKPEMYTLMVYILLLLTSALALSLTLVLVLPEKYYLDGNVIRSLLSEELELNFDPFIHTAWVYRLLGFSANTSRELVAVLVLLVALIPVIFCFFLGLRHTTYLNLSILGMWFFLSTIYLSQYSKELIAVWAVSLALIALHHMRPVAWVAAFGVVLGYGIFFRSYWILLAFIWIFLVWLSYRRWHLFLKVIALICVIFAISAAFQFAFGYHITEVRNNVNEFRVGSPDVHTMIGNVFPSENLLQDVANWLLCWFFILFPVPLFALFDIQYVLFGGLTTVTVLVVLRSWKALARVKRVLDSKNERLLRSAILFMFAFTLVQGIFEPDYGSVAKHMVNLLPVLAYVLAFGDTRSSG